MGTPLRVLIVEDSEEDTLLIVRELKRGGFDPIHERVETAESMKAALSTKAWDLILADYSMPHFSGLEALKLFKASGLDLPFIIVSGSIGEDVAVEAMKSGAHDYLMKSNLTRLIPAIQQELREAEVRRKLKHSEKALQEAEKRYRQVVENATEIIYSTNTKGNFTYGNPASLKVTGFSLEELRQYNYQDLVVPEHRERVMEIYVNQFRERLPTTYVEFPFFSKTGEIIWFAQNATLVIEGDKIVGFHIIARDITERKRVEEALRELEEKYRLLVENANEAIFVIQDGILRFFNIKNIELIGYSKEELTSTPFINFVHPDDREVTLGRYLKRIRGEELPGVNVFRIIDKTGNIKWAEINSVLISWEGRPATLNFLDDITERKRAEEVLRESQERFRLAFEDANIGMCLVDLNGRLTRVNQKMCEIFGYTRKELEELTVNDIAHPEDLNLSPTFMDRATSGEVEHAIFEKRYFHKNGHIVYGQVSSSLVRDAQGAPQYFISHVQDITERKQAEVALRQSEEKFKQLFDDAPVGYFEYDVQGRITSINRTELEMLGYALEEMIGQLVWKFVVEEEIARQQILAKLAGTMPPARGLERTYRRKDGTTFPAIVEDRLILDSEGKIKGIRATIQDITEHKKAEEALRSSEEKYRTILENIEDGYFEVDIAGNFTFYNDSLCRILGYSRDEMIGMNNRQYTDQENAKKLFQAFNKVYRTGEPAREFDWEIIRKDGTRRSIEASVSLLKDPSGNRIGFRGIVRDITERKRIEQEKTTLEEQLRQSQKMEAIGRLAGGVAHDFNNLLTVIKGYSQLSLTEMKKGDPLKENIEEIKKAADRAADLTRQLLAFSRRQVMEMKVLDLNDLLRNLDKMLRRVIGEDIELATILEENLGRVKTDPGQIEQVIMNLAVNARDAMSKGGKLTIETANVDLDQAYARAHVAVKPGPYVMISASDTGVGMPPEIRDRIFEPFFTTKEKGKGTGLGLSTVYGIVKQSSGNIWVYSEPEKGTTFKIYLPRVDEPFEELKEKLVKKELPRGNETILIVEDEEDVLKLAGRILSRQGYHVLEASSGEEALRICKKKKEPFHLLLTDVVMPQMSGRQLEEQLSRVCQDFKVLYMSGYTDNAITHHGVLEKGMNYIQKPFTVDGLIRKVREVLDK